ncbi:cysteine desulfurase [Leptospira selangorensis]|uniref:Cysteine desulfurase n=1 Tax=Leptospira selangorensis TaxID=2484982 RepID=A0A5F2C1L2_9LEPT|nr:family 2A encapsulin nanocompartment cargo protein cysteine desulfurase [Leptospira selangorensis]TGM11491.1 cysteine desulfurase [Leptospira selangorensis]TGM21140.1 cysteine desulfurase [Leptospira selangorensis]
MSTSDFSPELPGEFSRKDVSPPVDPNLIAEWSKKFFGPLSSGSNVDELVLSSSKIPNEIPANSQGVISQAESASVENFWTSTSGAGYTRVPDLGLSGVGVPTYPGGLNIPGAGQGLPGQNSPFSFLDEFRSFDSKAQNIQISDPFSFSPSLVPSVDISSGNFDLSYARKDFPILEEKVNGRNLVWLDNAATTHKPQAVIDRLSYFYKHENSNIHRGAHTLAARATDAYEAAREKVKGFLNSSSTEEIVFVRGATEAINLVAQTWGRQNIGKDDEILISWLEHHANIVPWQMLCSEKGAKLKVIPVDETGQIILSEYQRLLTPKTRIVAFTQVSNALGTVTPAGTMIELAHKQGAKVLLDGAQAVSHMPVDVQALDCDFYVFSGHKVFAPTGIGVLFGKKEILDQMTPWQGGGNMIQDVTFERTVYQPAPFRFEAGTGNIADAVGLGAAIDYLNKFGMIRIAEYEHSLLEYGTKELKKIPGLKMIGTAPDKAGVLSFVLEGFKTEDVGRYLAQEGIAVRSGHHCAQPILRRFGLESTVRPSLAFYNTCEDIDALIRALYDLKGGRTSGPL